ncbi:peptidyl-prolyl cis-trans isomerase [Enterococcus sp. CR-Ec1]|uniref:peptidyl-prolyl cis-trans isomerase n=1 Tax=Enterococcus sp. CR-Ec1 TaxID=2057791 RepID=UPI000C75A3B1|nr:peptidyl-prolyl cis-trans isomerase [Enterococcus sp. CR-Ec1]AUJ85495.1 peptidylprolyl isomerase [Enterococcus sp. CR-Ec1]
MRKKLLFVAMSVGLLLFSACSKSDEKETAVSFKGGTITQKDINDQLKKIKGADSAIQQMVIKRVYENKYGEEITEKDIEKEFNKIKEQAGKSFNSQLAKSGDTEAELKRKIKQQLAFKKGLETNVEVNQEKIQKIWETFHPEVKVQQIKFKNEEDAKKAKQSLDEGEDFSKLVKEKSIDQKSNSNDGKVTFHSHTSSVPEEVKEASFKLNNKDISDIIPVKNLMTKQTSYYIVKMIQNQEKGDDIEKYSDELKKIAIEKQLADQEFVKQSISQELKAANVKIKDATLNNIMDSLIHQEKKQVPNKDNKKEEESKSKE